MSVESSHSEKEMSWSTRAQQMLEGSLGFVRPEHAPGKWASEVNTTLKVVDGTYLARRADLLGEKIRIDYPGIPRLQPASIKQIIQLLQDEVKVQFPKMGEIDYDGIIQAEILPVVPKPPVKNVDQLTMMLHLQGNLKINARPHVALSIMSDGGMFHLPLKNDGMSLEKKLFDGTSILEVTGRNGSYLIVMEADNRDLIDWMGTGSGGPYFRKREFTTPKDYPVLNIFAFHLLPPVRESELPARLLMMKLHGLLNKVLPQPSGVA